ncbi:MAG: helix-turn-helix domain-containing protein [Cyanobacteria bacterium J06623_7]
MNDDGNAPKAILVDLTQSNPIQPDDVRSPLLSSNPLGWQNLNFNYFQYGNCETPLHTFEHHTIGLILDRGRVERKLGAKYQLERAIVGSSVVIPARVEHWSAWEIEGRFAMISLNPHKVANLDPNTINPDTIELIPTFATSQVDPLIYGVGQAIKQHLRLHSATDNTYLGGEGLYIEHLTNAIAAHLLQHYCTRQVKLKTYSGGSGGLGKQKLALALDYIHGNLAEKIELKDIARELDLSQYYFAHLFRNSTGISPYQYIIQQRVAKAKKLLRDSEKTLIEIALACGFSSQSQMTIHFRKWNLTTPKKYRALQKNNGK